MYLNPLSLDMVPLSLDLDPLLLNPYLFSYLISMNHLLLKNIAVCICMFVNFMYDLFYLIYLNWTLCN